MTRSLVTVSIEPISHTDQDFLWEALYQALHVPSGATPFPRSIVQTPDIRKYAEDWGQNGDTGRLARCEATQQPVGALWLRLFQGEHRGYGYIDDQTPELSMAVLPEYRGQGIGTKLMTSAFRYMSYPAVSLSVSKTNPARRLYERFDFAVVKEDGDALIMRWENPREGTLFF